MNKRSIGGRGGAPQSQWNKTPEQHGQHITHVFRPGVPGREAGPVEGHVVPTALPMTWDILEFVPVPQPGFPPPLPQVQQPAGFSDRSARYLIPADDESSNGFSNGCSTESLSDGEVEYPYDPQPSAVEPVDEVRQANLREPLAEGSPISQQQEPRVGKRPRIEAPKLANINNRLSQEQQCRLDHESLFREPQQSAGVQQQRSVDAFPNHRFEPFRREPVEMPMQRVPSMEFAVQVGNAEAWPPIPENLPTRAQERPPLKRIAGAALVKAFQTFGMRGNIALRSAHLIKLQTHRSFDQMVNYVEGLSSLQRSTVCNTLLTVSERLQQSNSGAAELAAILSLFTYVGPGPRFRKLIGEWLPQREWPDDIDGLRPRCVTGWRSITAPREGQKIMKGIVVSRYDF